MVLFVFLPFFAIAKEGGGLPGPGEPGGGLPGPGEPGGGLPGPGEGGGVSGLKNPLKAKTVSQLLVIILEVARDLGFIVAIFFIVYSGFLFVTARGNDQKLERAKKAFLWAIVGTAVLLGAQVFATIIQSTVNEISHSPTIYLTLNYY